MKNIRKLLGLAAVALVFSLVLSSVTPAKAWYDQDGNWHSERIRHVDRNRGILRDSDRVVLKDYIATNSVYCRDSHRRHCRVRPAHIVFYQPGSALPGNVVYRQLPQSVVARLTPAPSGAEYVRANDNIYLINRQNRTVIDAVSFSGGQ